MITYRPSLSILSRHKIQSKFSKRRLVIRSYISEIVKYIRRVLLSMVEFRGLIFGAGGEGIIGILRYVITACHALSYPIEKGVLVAGYNKPFMKITRY